MIGQAFLPRNVELPQPPKTNPPLGPLMPVFRTPDDRFAGLPGFPFTPHYVDVNGLRIHYVDEGTGAPILCLHGEPTWSYLYRKMIPPLAEKHRVVAFDFVGFGRSDKLTEASEYSFDLHRETMRGVLEALDLRGLTLVVHDWGGLVGLKVATEMPDRIDRLVVLNTFLPDGTERKSEAFLQWRNFVARTPDLPVGRLVALGTADPSRVPPEVQAAYDAPFPDAASKAGAAVWPLMVPMTPDDPVARAMVEARRGLAGWHKPAFVLFSDADPILGAAHRFFKTLLPTAGDQPETFIEGAGHFLQEEAGERIAPHILAFMARTGA